MMLLSAKGVQLPSPLLVFLQLGVVYIHCFILREFAGIRRLSAFRIGLAGSVSLVRRLTGGGRLVLHVVPQERDLSDLAFALRHSLHLDLLEGGASLALQKVFCLN